MPESKRQCSTCIFFRNAQLSGNGWCTHPQRQLASDVKILVRERELACRNTWGDDLWADKSLPATTSSPAQHPSRGVTYLNTRQDDEVTSVVDAADRLRAAAPTDDVITVTSIRSDNTSTEDARRDINSPAVADQEERARVMARGSRDAIISARKRHVQKRHPQSEPPAESAEDAIVSSTTAPLPAASNPELVLPSQPKVSAIHSESDHSAQGVTASTSNAHRQPPRVTPAVDLPRLRTFLLNPDDASADTTSQGFTTHYDHVLNQAEKIKERAAREPVRPPRPATSSPSSQHGRGAPFGGQASADTPSRLDMTFARARAAIYRPSPQPVLESEPELIEAPEVFEDVAPQAAFQSDQYPVEPEIVPAVLHMEHDDDESPLIGTDEWVARFPEDEIELASSSDADVFRFDDRAVASEEPALLSATEEPELFDAPAYAEDTIQADTPGRSLWRSFNFGFKRRYKPAPEIQDDVEEDWSYQDSGPVFHESLQDDEWADGDAESYDEDEWSYAASALNEAEPEYAYSGDGLTEPVAARSRQSLYVSSEENWELDLREFPEPQPVEWHETRSELLSRLPEAEPVSTSQQWESTPYADDMQDEVSWMYPEPFQYADVEPEPVRPLPARRKFMDLAQEDGMDAYRDALFGSHSPAPTYAPPVYTEVRSGRREQAVVQAEAYPVAQREPRYEESVYEPVPAVMQEPIRRKAERTRTPRQAHEPARAFPDLAEPDIRPTAESTVPKSCLTCRSFQPSEDRDRGWCTNVHASTNRQMVNSAELACRSSIGDWWIRNDASWLPPESRIQPSTPHSDQLAASAEPRDEERSRWGRGVRTRKSG